MHGYAERDLGADSARLLLDPIRAISVADFRADPDLTRALAQAHDGRVQAWAIAQLADQSQRVALLPLQALVLDFGARRDAMLRTVYCQSSERRTLLIETLGEVGGADDAAFAARIAADQSLGRGDREALDRAAARLFARAAASRDGSGEDYALLRQILRGERPNAWPIRCPAH